MGRWAAAEGHAAQNRMEDPIRAEMMRRIQSRDAALYSFDSPEPVHPRSPLPREVSSEMVGRQIQPVYRTAQGIMDEYQGLSGDRKWVPTGQGKKVRPETHQEFWDRKYSEIEGTTVARSLDRSGVRNPISLRAPGARGQTPSERPEILGGHHRVAYMQRHQPNQLLPVRNFNTGQEAKDQLGNRY